MPFLGLRTDDFQTFVLIDGYHCNEVFSQMAQFSRLTTPHVSPVHQTGRPVQVILLQLANQVHQHRKWLIQAATSRPLPINDQPELQLRCQIHTHHQHPPHHHHQNRPIWYHLMFGSSAPSYEISYFCISHFYTFLLYHIKTKKLNQKLLPHTNLMSATVVLDT